MLLTRAGEFPQQPGPLSTRHASSGEVVFLSAQRRFAHDGLREIGTLPRVRRAVDSRAVDHSGEIGATRLPLVVDIHGGPHVSANVWGYDREVQFFASRGYAVLQPQFRGTGGFGLKHLTSSYREWGLAMQDNLEDGVRWAVEEGIADARRACYYGGSYGGFAAIVGTIKSAGFVRCAVAVAAPTSIDYLFDSNETDLSRLADRSTLMESHIGDPHTDRVR